MPLPSQNSILRSLARFTLAAAASSMAAAPASATVLNATQLNVYRDGTSAEWLLGNRLFLGDSFDNDLPFVGPNFVGSSLASTYSLQGLDVGADAALAVREQGGSLLLDPNYGAVSANALGGFGRSLRLRLLTNIDPSLPNAGLPRSRSFAAALRLSLTSMPNAGESVGFRLSDGFSNNNDVIELFVAEGASGDTIVFRTQDFALPNPGITVHNTAPLVAPIGADSLVLVLRHAAPDTDQIYGVYGYADASGALMGDLITFANPATAFDGESFTRVELRATTLVPEPGSWAMLAGGLGLLLTRLRRRG